MHVAGRRKRSCRGIVEFALARGVRLFTPPATSTLPLFSRVAVCCSRAVARLPVVLKVPATGSYSSVVAVSPALAAPPVTSTLPLFSRVAVCNDRATCMLPVAVNVLVPGLYNWAVASGLPLLSVPP